MGQKVNPHGMRLGISKNWISNWYAEKDYADSLLEDIKIRQYLKDNIKRADIARIEIDRFGSTGQATKNAVRINLFSSRPGMIIGKKGEESTKLKKKLTTLLPKHDVILNIKELKKPEIDAMYVAQNICLQIERRLPFRRVMKKALQNAMKYNIEGCKIKVGGRLNGAEMARQEWIREGSVPLHTFKANIDYAFYEANTIYGKIGVKVWIYKSKQQQQQQQSGKKNIKPQNNSRNK